MSAPTKAMILDMLRSWVNQRPGLEFGNYGDVSAYRSELRAITRDRREALELMSAVALRESIRAEDLAAAFPRAYSGRLRFTEDAKKPGRYVLDYCTGQYWPTEYRKAACAVLASALWDHVVREMPKPQAFTVECFEDVDGRCNYRNTRATSKTWDTREEAQAYSDTVAKSRNPRVRELVDGISQGDWIRRYFRREFGRSVAARWFN